MKNLDMRQLKQLAHELRWETSSFQNGGHLSSSLGCQRTDSCLHYVFDMPEDIILGRVAPVLSAQNSDARQNVGSSSGRWNLGFASVGE
jgi:hypothetical protein